MGLLPRYTVLAAIVVAALCARDAAASLCQTGPVVQWKIADGGNGHFYQAFCGPVTWSQANAATVAAGKHLVSITSSAENAFVFSLIDSADFWATPSYGPWTGGVQPPAAPEPAGDWGWVTGESFSFDAWYSGEPNNAGEEDNILFYDGSAAGARSAQWADVGGSFGTSYVTEWEHSLDVDLDGETQPLTDGLLVLRYLFGFTGPTLTAGAVDLTNCKRCDAAAIQAYLGLLVGGLSYDATADWSDATNPNGPWSYLEGTNALPHVASWQSILGGYSSAQPGWARSENGVDRIPFFSKSLGFETFEHDWMTGDVVVHTWDATNGIGNGNARLRFTVPYTGIYRTDLAIWIGRDISRSVDWKLNLNDVQQASGNVASGDGFSRSSPATSTKSLALAAGDQVDLRLDTASMSGDFVGLRLRFEAFGFDVDGDGETQPLTDGLLVLRRLFGFTGTTLTSGAIDLSHCTRCDDTAVTTFLDGFNN